MFCHNIAKIIKHIAVCSKNHEETAREVFSNPDMILRLEDIAVFCANWNSKAENILKIAEQLNILSERMVFIDDNPAERELIRRALPEVKVPEVNSVVISTPREFLMMTKSGMNITLPMSSKIRSFDPVDLDRITQLINKTNQFNLTTKRYGLSEIEKACRILHQNQ